MLVDISSHPSRKLESYSTTLAKCGLLGFDTSREGNCHNGSGDNRVLHDWSDNLRRVLLLLNFGEEVGGGMKRREVNEGVRGLLLYSSVTTSPWGMYFQNSFRDREARFRSI